MHARYFFIKFILIFIQIQLRECWKPSYSNKYKIENKNGSSDVTINGIYAENENPTIPNAIRTHFHWQVSVANIKRYDNQCFKEYSLFLTDWSEQDNNKGYDWMLFNVKDNTTISDGTIVFPASLNDEHAHISVFYDDALIQIIGDEDLFDVKDVWAFKLKMANDKSNALLALQRETYPYYPDLYEIVCTTTLSIDSCKVINGFYQKVGDSGICKQMIAGTSGSVIEWLVQSWGFSSVDRNDVQEYHNGKGAVLLIGSNYDRGHKNYGYAMFDTTSGKWRPGTSHLADSFERDVNGIRFIINNAQPLPEVIKEHEMIKAVKLSEFKYYITIKEAKHKGDILKSFHREYPYHAPKYEIVCVSTRRPDPCVQINGRYEQIAQIPAYDAMIDNVHILEWLRNSWGFIRLRPNDVSVYSNGNGATLYIASDDVSNSKLNGYAVETKNGEQSYWRQGISDTADTFERVSNGVHFIINNAVSLMERVKEQNSEIAALKNCTQRVLEQELESAQLRKKRCIQNKQGMKRKRVQDQSDVQSNKRQRTRYILL